MKRNRKRIIFGFLILVIFLWIELSNRLLVREYVVQTEKFTGSVRIVLLADLHNALWGQNQQDLLKLIFEQDPDLILMAGDIADARRSNIGTISLLEGIADKYPCYYVTGNHELWDGDVVYLKEMFRSYGVRVLEGENEKVIINNQLLTICGIDDPSPGRGHIDNELFNKQLENASAGISGYAILLTHRPERIAQYAEYEYDLILSAHAHGGQWQIPFILNGVASPDQGFFPEYAGGLYEYNDGQMIVSRGLDKYLNKLPRLFNPWEVVVADIVGTQ
jgi:predicted MPP superfamily phosphohydrolase